MATTVIESRTQDFNNALVPTKKSLLADAPAHHQQTTVIDPKTLIGEALQQRVQNVDHELCEPGDEDTFFVADLGEVYRQHLRWKKNLPGVRPFYGELPPLLLSSAAVGHVGRAF